MENSLGRKELVAILMESSFYFELSLKERLALVQRQEWRFSQCERRDNCTLLIAAKSIVRTPG
jgi:hypothetical protein